MTLQQVRCCTSPGLGVAVFRGHGIHRGRAFTRSWLKGDQPLAMAVGQEGVSLARAKTSMKTGGNSFRMIHGIPCAALQSESRIGVKAMDEKIYGSDLQGFAQRVAACNEGRVCMPENIALVLFLSFSYMYYLLNNLRSSIG